MKIETETLSEDVESRYPEPFDCAVDNELRAILAQGLRSLPLKQALAVEGCFYDLKSYRQIGRELDCSHENVRALKAKGLKTLREILSFLAGIFDSPSIQKKIQSIQKRNINRLSQERYASMTPSQKEERNRQLGHLWYLKNKDVLLSKNKRIYREDKAYHYWRSWKWVQKNLESHKNYQRQYAKQRSENLVDVYVAERLIEGTCLTKQDIPQSLIKIKRTQLQLIRSLERKDKP